MRYKIETERSDLFDVSILIAMNIHIKGDVTEDSLSLAFKKATESYEILVSKVVIEDDGSAYYENSLNMDQDIKDKNKVEKLELTEKYQKSIMPESGLMTVEEYEVKSKAKTKAQINPEEEKEYEVRYLDNTGIIISIVEKD